MDIGSCYRLIKVSSDINITNIVAECCADSKCNFATKPNPFVTFAIADWKEHFKEKHSSIAVDLV